MCLCWYSLFHFLNSKHEHPLLISVCSVLFVLMKYHGSYQRAICRRVMTVHFFCQQGTLFFMVLLFFFTTFWPDLVFLSQLHLVSFWSEHPLKMYFILNHNIIDQESFSFHGWTKTLHYIFTGQVMLILKIASSCEHLWFKLFSFLWSLISRQSLSALFCFFFFMLIQWKPNFEFSFWQYIQLQYLFQLWGVGSYRLSIPVMNHNFLQLFLSWQCRRSRMISVNTGLLTSWPLGQLFVLGFPAT